jgi:hypothetical protein
MMKKHSIRQLLITGIPSILILAGVAVVSIILDINLGLLTRDPTSIAKINPLSGILSNFGIILWCSAASVCLFASIAIRKKKSNDWFWFLFCSGILSAYLLFDDFFQFHEILAGDHVGISEKFTYFSLGISVLIYLFIFRRNIWQTNYSFLVISFIFLACSVAADVFQRSLMLRVGHWQFFIEEGAKWFGIACWCSYYLHSSYHIVEDAFLTRLK